MLGVVDALGDCCVVLGLTVAGVAEVGGLDILDAAVGLAVSVVMVVV